MACFHAQQVAELALKAYLYAQGEAIVLPDSIPARVFTRDAAMTAVGLARETV